MNLDAQFEAARNRGALEEIHLLRIEEAVQQALDASSGCSTEAAAFLCKCIEENEHQLRLLRDCLAELNLSGGAA